MQSLNNIFGYSCLGCSLAGYYCLCDVQPSLVSRAQGSLLLHSRELTKFSNTGKLVRHCLGDFHCQTWQRKSDIDLSSDGSRQVVLVFPSDETVQTVEPNDSQYWLIIDATWQQAKKMLRQSPLLQSLPRVSISPSQQSRYRLRRNQTETGLATVEVMASLLAGIGEDDNAECLLGYFEAFMTAYERQRQDQRIANV